ncbi:MAG: hypothetical protein HY789_09270 [Deltaproteobacteria bacterium]|nr:hypothetical protein [Deltaproteobacteria bacterium]
MSTDGTATNNKESNAFRVPRSRRMHNSAQYAPLLRPTGLCHESGSTAKGDRQRPPVPSAVLEKMHKGQKNQNPHWGILQEKTCGESAAHSKFLNLLATVFRSKT